jgi:uncharacterized RDD family membrane protein YckC
MSAGLTGYTFDESLTDGVMLRRIWAWLFDLLLVGGIMIVLWVMLVGFGLLTFGLGFPLLGLLPVVPLLYPTLFVASSRGATPGQVLMDLAVCRDADLGRPSLLQAVLFTVGLWLTLGAGVIWLGTALVTNRHRTLHDLVSGLVVVRSGALHRMLTPTAGFGNMQRGSPYA